MNIHEYQAKQLLAQYGVAVPGGQAVKTAAEAKAVAEKLFAAAAAARSVPASTEARMVFMLR